jgi:hypothetical protein
MTEPTSEERDTLHALTQPLLKAVRDIRNYLAGPPAPDAEVRSWPLYTAAEEGGIFCGDPDCPFQAESSEIGDFRVNWRTDQAPTFTLDQLHAAIGDHIARRREREADDS